MPPIRPGSSVTMTKAHGRRGKSTTPSPASQRKNRVDFRWRVRQDVPMKTDTKPPMKSATERAQEKIEAVVALKAWLDRTEASVEMTAKRLQVTEQTVYNWINGERLPTGRRVTRILTLVATS